MPPKPQKGLGTLWFSKISRLLYSYRVVIGYCIQCGIFVAGWDWWNVRQLTCHVTAAWSCGVRYRVRKGLAATPQSHSAQRPHCSVRSEAVLCSVRPRARRSPVPVFRVSVPCARLLRRFCAIPLLCGVPRFPLSLLYRLPTGLFLCIVVY